MLVPRKTTMDYKIDSLMHKTPQTGEDRAAQRQKKSGSVSKEREDEELLNRENEELLNLPHKCKLLELLIPLIPFVECNGLCI